jgi:hypothetical protein
MKPSLSIIAAIAALAAAAPAYAEREWGALALSERSTAYGYARDYDTQEGASERALAECAKNAGDCRVHTAFRNTCLVLAGSIDGPFGWAWGAPERTRAQRAVEQCRQRGAINCKVVETICSGTASGPKTPGYSPRTRVPERPGAPTPATTTPATPPSATPPAAKTTPPATATPSSTPPDTRAPGTPTPLHRQ